MKAFRQYMTQKNKTTLSKFFNFLVGDMNITLFWDMKWVIFR